MSEEKNPTTASATEHDPVIAGTPEAAGASPAPKRRGRRTAVVAALLLLLAGVSDGDLLADYMLSASYLEARWRTQKFFMSEFLPQTSHMRGFLELFRKEYGDVERYLLGIGLTEEEVWGLKDRLVDRV